MVLVDDFGDGGTYADVCIDFPALTAWAFEPERNEDTAHRRSGAWRSKNLNRGPTMRNICDALALFSSKFAPLHRLRRPTLNYISPVQSHMQVRFTYATLRH